MRRPARRRRARSPSVPARPAWLRRLRGLPHDARAGSCAVSTASRSRAGERSALRKDRIDVAIEIGQAMVEIGVAANDALEMERDARGNPFPFRNARRGCEVIELRAKRAHSFVAVIVVLA